MISRSLDCVAIKLPLLADSTSVHANAHHRAILGVNVERRYSRGSWQSLLVVTPLFAAAEMRRQMTEAGARVRARLRPFVAEFLSDVQLSLRFNSLSSTERGGEGAGERANASVLLGTLPRFTSA